MRTGVPYNVMRHARWDAAPRTGVEVGLASLIFGGGVVTAGQLTFASLLVNVAVTAVTSWALAALTPKPDFGSLGSAGLMVNAREAAAPHDVVYGQVRKGGVVTYYETTGTNNKFLHQIISVAGHEVEELGDIYINDEVVTLDTNGFVTGDKWQSKIRINKHLGDQTTADADLLNESNQIDSSFVGNGIAYLYVRFEYDQDVFANGLPLITTVVKGKKVYDPRTDTTAYNANAALCLRDYVTSAYGLNDDDIDEVVFQAAANISDEQVTLKDGVSTENRYEMNGVIKAGTKHGDVINRMVTTCAGTLFWGAGNWKLTAGAYSAPTKTLTLDDLRGPISLSTRTNLRDQFNIVQGTFNEAPSAQNPDARWITADYPQINSETDAGDFSIGSAYTILEVGDTDFTAIGASSNAVGVTFTATGAGTGSGKASLFLGEDGGEEQALDFELPLTTSSAMAQRLAKLTLFRGREQMTFSADFGLNAFDVEVGEIIALSIDRYGWVQKEFEVIGWNMGPNAEQGDTRITLTLRETSEDAFDWNAEETAIIANNSNLLSAFDVPAIGIPADQITPSLRIVREKLTEVISINVTSGRPEGVSSVEVQFRESGASDWKALGSGDLGIYEAVDLEPGVYQFRARAINGFGKRGDWTTTAGTQTAGSAAPPQDVSGLFYEISEGTTTLEWEPVTDLDLSFYRIRHAVETSGATWANATTAVDKVPRPGTSVALPTRPGTYMIRAYDKTGIASQNYTSVVVSSDEVPSYTQSLSQAEHTTFSGTKTDCEVVSNELRITDPSTGPSEATYDFSTYIETHDNTARRVRARVDAATVRLDESAGLWDDLPGLFDDLPGLFDDFTGAAQFADTNLLFYVSTTPDDPTGTPTWSDYKQFRAGEFYGRAFRFRVVLKSTSNNVTPSVSELTAFVEYS